METAAKHHNKITALNVLDDKSRRLRASLHVHRSMANIGAINRFPIGGRAATSSPNTS
jgi:hypothetical protein